MHIEGCASFVVITDHRPLIHIPRQPNVGRRHVPWDSVLSQYIDYMKIVYRKGSENDSDVRIIRRGDLADLIEENIIDDPVLRNKIEDYDARIFEKELEDLKKESGYNTR